MTQCERREFLIRYLLNERGDSGSAKMPGDGAGQRRLLRALMNVRAPGPIGEEFLAVQDEYLRERLRERGVTDVSWLEPVEPGIYLWQGDITTLRCGAIVNAANSGLTGCYAPNHGCIDNAIHTFADVGLRLECAEIMARQGHGEPAGRAKITGAYNLPCDYVLHTVGPIIRGRVGPENEELLASCYRSCLKLAGENKIESVAFCCISTGEFRFPRGLAAQIAVETVRRCRGDIEVVFNVFKDEDREIYAGLLGGR